MAPTTGPRQGVSSDASVVVPSTAALHTAEALVLPRIIVTVRSTAASRAVPILLAPKRTMDDVRWKATLLAAEALLTTEAALLFTTA